MSGKKNISSCSLPQGGPFTGLLGGDERGAVSVLVAVLLVVLIGFAGLVVDLGHLFVVRSTLQNAADSASLAAAVSLNYGPDEARGQAQLLAHHHAVDGTSVTLALADIELGTWDKETKTFTVLDPAQEQNADSVRVTAQRSQDRNNPVALFFMPLFGHQASDVRATAVAYYQGSLCGPIFGDRLVGLSGNGRTDSYNSLQGPYTSPGGDNGDVCSNGPITLQGQAGVNGNATPGPGESVSISGSAYVTGSTWPMASTTDPPPIDLGDIATNNDNDLIPYNLNLVGFDQLTLTGGRYYFTSLKILGDAMITVTGETVIYITVSLEVGGGGILNQSQKPPNLSILVTSTNNTKIGGNGDFHGVVYAPDSKVQVGGNGDIYGAVVGKEIDVSGGGIHYDEALNDVLVLNKMEVPVTRTSSILVQ